MKPGDRYVCEGVIVDVEQVDRVKGVVWYKFQTTGNIRAERIRVFLFNYRPLTLDTVLERTPGSRLFASPGSADPTGLVPPQEAARATGGTLFFTFSGVVIGPPLFGAAGSALGGLAWAFALLALPLAVVLAVMARSRWAST